MVIFQSSNDFSKAAQQLLNKTEAIHISQEGISSRLWSYWLESDEIMITGSAQEQYSHCCMQWWVYSSDSQTFWWWRSGRILQQDRSKHKISNRLTYPFHCYPFDLRFSADIFDVALLFFKMQKLESVI